LYTRKDLPDGSILIEWQKVDHATAERFLRTHTADLKRVMSAKVTRASTPEEYIAKILDKIDDTQVIRGKHHYYPSTGYYVYEQQAVMTGAVAGWIANNAGAGDITGAALKIAYIMIREPAKAGGSGKEGPKVQTMDKSVISPGK
jgi:hypothetical protein